MVDIRSRRFCYRSVFGNSNDAKLSAHLGWNANDGILFSGRSFDRVRTDPSPATDAKTCLSTGLSGATLDRMLPSFVHSAGK
jgi:hypothetical protein